MQWPTRAIYRQIANSNRRQHRICVKVPQTQGNKLETERFYEWIRTRQDPAYEADDSVKNNLESQSDYKAQKRPVNFDKNIIWESFC